MVFYGAGGYEEDRSIADKLGLLLGAEVSFPRLPDDHLVAAWTVPIRAKLARATPSDVLVAHSFGASMLLAALQEITPAPPRAALLAMPNWGPEGWAAAEYDSAAYLVPPTLLSLHHCRDDEIVPFDHLALNSAALPNATRREYATGGHQFDGRIEAIAADLPG